MTDDISDEFTIEAKMAEAERKAWDALARYKFWMFGYWAAIWVHLNHLRRPMEQNPFRAVVVEARHHSSLTTAR